MQKFVSPSESVVLFLGELKDILKNPNFNLDTDLKIITKKKKEHPGDPCSTFNTLIKLEFDRQDIRSELRIWKIIWKQWRIMWYQIHPVFLFLKK
jgi:hypothetical protein